MFTGLVQGAAKVVSITPREADGARLTLTHPLLASARAGDSIATNGCCLTVVEKGEGWFAVEVSGETLEVTTLGDWTAGKRVNLERAARLGDELGGHIVSGHVDGIGEVLSVESEGGSHRVQVRAPRPLHRHIASKGSITIEGVSLTVNEVEDDVFGVNLIPHTWDVTTLGQLAAGSRVNLEIDMLARYLARWRETA